SHDETAEFDKEETIEGIEQALRNAGFRTVRIGHIRNLVQRLSVGERWDMVFNIAEGMYGLAREAQVPCLLDAYRIPYVFSDSSVLALSLHKGLTKRVVRDAGIPTPEFTEIYAPDDIQSVNLPFPLFAKPVAEGTGKGITGSSRINSLEQLRSVCLHLLETYHQPVLVERYLSGREFTVGIVGTGENARVVGVMEITLNGSASEIYSLFVKENYENFARYSVPEKEVQTACSRIALNAWRILGCRDGGRIDLKMDENGIPNFLEVNPLAGLNYKHSDLPLLCKLNGIDFQSLIEMIMNSALKRLPEYAGPYRSHSV
ncbi:MAG TPA: hypothetical protein PK825_04295, partial [Bacteroidales bacterium]|nr:hypothetical protein [Bacteroidales bacterium]